MQTLQTTNDAAGEFALRRYYPPPPPPPPHTQTPLYIHICPVTAQLQLPRNNCISLTHTSVSPARASMHKTEFTFTPLLLPLLIPLLVLPLAYFVDKNDPLNRGAAVVDNAAANKTLQPARLLAGIGHSLAVAVALLHCVGPAGTSNTTASDATMFSIAVRCSVLHQPRCGCASVHSLAHMMLRPPTVIHHHSSLPLSQAWSLLSFVQFALSGFATLVGSSTFSPGANASLAAFHWLGSIVVTQWIIVGDGGLASHALLWWELALTGIPAVVIELYCILQIVLTNARWRDELCWPFVHAEA